MRSELAIAVAEVGKASLVTDILNAAFLEFKNQYTPRAFRATVILASEVEKRMEKGTVWLAYLNNKPVGTVSGKIKGKAFYIQGMGVVPDARGKKVGYELLLVIESFARKMDCAELRLCTTPYLKAAIRLYEKFGFKIINDSPFDLHGTPLFTMTKALE